MSDCHRTDAAGYLECHGMLLMLQPRIDAIHFPDEAESASVFAIQDVVQARK
jgi:hypothetical protein